MGTTSQAANLLVAAMERDGLVRREPHPTHGRILEIYPTAEVRTVATGDSVVASGRPGDRRAPWQTAVCARGGRERVARCG